MLPVTALASADLLSLVAVVSLVAVAAIWPVECPVPVLPLATSAVDQTTLPGIVRLTP